MSYASRVRLVVGCEDSAKIAERADKEIAELKAKIDRLTDAFHKIHDCNLEHESDRMVAEAWLETVIFRILPEQKK